MATGALAASGFRLSYDTGRRLRGTRACTMLEADGRMDRRILLIEDDRDLGAQVVQHLETIGFKTLWWTEGRLLSSADASSIRLAIIDLMLPGTYGLDVLKHLRTISDVPVLVLSARNDSSDKVRALELGADDYLTKPFWPEELIERVRARLRRPVLEREGTLEVGPLRIDFQRRTRSEERRVGKEWRA